MNGTYGDRLAREAGPETWARLAALDLVASVLLAVVLTGIYLGFTGHRELARFRPAGRRGWFCLGVGVWLLAQAFLAFVFTTQILPEDGFELAARSPSR